MVLETVFYSLSHLGWYSEKILLYMKVECAVSVTYLLQVVELHNMMTRNEATLGPDGHVAMVNGEGTTLIAVAPNSDENGVVPFRKQGSAQNNIVGSSKDNHVCSICKSA